MQKMMLAAIAVLATALLCQPAWADEITPKPSPDQVIQMFKDGNARFVAGKAQGPHRDPARLALAAKDSQSRHAYATVLSCSDSRVPVELLFDAGVMDIFVVRVAGNVAKADEIGSVEYGMTHVLTPLLVVMGHTKCGAVNAVVEQLEGRGQQVARNIPPLLAPIAPAVRLAQAQNPDKKGRDLAALAERQNVWLAIEAIVTQSPAVREMIRANKAKVVGAIYHVESGEVEFLPAAEIAKIMDQVAANPDAPTNPMYDEPKTGTR